MSRTTLRTFQDEAVKSGLTIFGECRRLLDLAGNHPAGRMAAISQHGTLLIEAPTGSGKTLLAGTLAEKFSSSERVVWFWFAPFKGVVGQTAAALRAECAGLRLRELAVDRNADGSRTGDVFVTTWQTVATKAKDLRNVHRKGEGNLTVEELVSGLRMLGLRIGVVVDEAHHGFFGSTIETQAMKFFREVLQPEYTVLVTATPDDTDVKQFQEKLGLARLNRITIGRSDPVREGLIKTGVKCAAYLAREDQRALVDFEGTALRDGAAIHRRIKAELKATGIEIAPLLLVQVDSSDRSVERAKERLQGLGFTETQIAIHTADEPDADLLALANDEAREVLVFKMAVALGFDAPRAFTLVSMRAARDEDFGVQLVGRILRVHRRLQGRARAGTLPPLLKYGYVFLADASAQEGLDRAGQRINKLQTSYAQLSPTTAVVQVAGQTQVQVVGIDGQTRFFDLTSETQRAAPGVEEAAGTTEDLARPTGGIVGWLMEDMGVSTAPTAGTATAGGVRRNAQGVYPYPLRSDVPRRFKTQSVAADNVATEEDCAQRFVVSSAEILRALAAKVGVKRRTLEVFTHQQEMEFTYAELDPEQAARAALKVLTRNQNFDARVLRQTLLAKLKATLAEEGLDESEDESRIAHMLNVILTGHPELLYDAQKAALAAHFTVEETEEELPAEIANETPLIASRYNVYQVVPADLNGWERSFAEELDGDDTNIVLWWHRNLPNKPWSVQVLLKDGGRFFPDFVIGIDGRKREQSALLADPKYYFEHSDELQKTYAEHPSYGRVLILCQDATAHWLTVRYDAKQDRAVRGPEFRIADAAGY